MARHTISLSPTHEKIVEELMALCDLKLGEIIADGLILLSWAALEASDGMKIAAINEDTRVFKEVRTPALLAAARNGMVPEGSFSGGTSEATGTN